ncbi:hypothetical protein NDA01_22185 [Trichocoleus desertorum AS-A10]|uniref:hypothetical protein n=1 Tax=Trichocoleus desertorum TaxID=1481672 RepID=UPI003298FF76
MARKENYSAWRSGSAIAKRYSFLSSNQHRLWLILNLTQTLWPSVIRIDPQSSLLTL